MQESMSLVLLRELIGILVTALRTRAALTSPTLKALWWVTELLIISMIMMTRLLKQLIRSVSYQLKFTLDGKQITAPFTASLSHQYA